MYEGVGRGLERVEKTDMGSNCYHTYCSPKMVPALILNISGNLPAISQRKSISSPYQTLELRTSPLDEVPEAFSAPVQEESGSRVTSDDELLGKCYLTLKSKSGKRGQDQTYSFINKTVQRVTFRHSLNSLTARHTQVFSVFSPLLLSMQSSLFHRTRRQ